MPTIRHIKRLENGTHLYDAVYWVNGKQRHRRIKAESRAGAERIIALDKTDSTVNIRWSEAWTLFKEFRCKGGKITRSLENTEHAVNSFLKIVGDIELAKTTPEIFKDFMIKYAGLSARSTAGAANHQRKELLAVARFTVKHTGKLKEIPFANVPKLPAKVNKRAPIPSAKIQDYISALPEYIKRPILMVLFYGLRSSAVCAIDEGDIRQGILYATDKGDMERRIPVDDTLREIIDAALAFKTGLKVRSPAPVFVNLKGSRWTAKTLLKAAQTAWEKGDLEPIKIHEVRHTLGTEAGKFFPVGIIQVLMGHKSRKSSENYFHPNEEMAVEARKKLVRFLYGFREIEGKNAILSDTPVSPKTRQISCPHCGHNFIIDNE